MVTSAIPIGARLRVPLKMTSSIFSPRRDLALCSPKTHAMASETLLLPQPLGPTMAVIPASWTVISPRSENDLKPMISIRRNFSMSFVFQNRRLARLSPLASLVGVTDWVHLGYRRGERHEDF